jgi:hypothetical protein
MNVEYWRINAVNARFPWDEVGAVVEVHLIGFASKAARQAGKDPVPSAFRQVNIAFPDRSHAENLTIAAVYAAVQAISPEFADAESD